MKFNSEESIFVLKNALEKEKAAENFYNEKTRMLEIPAAREIFSDLASDEHHHFEMVSDLLKQAESGVVAATVSLPATSDSKSNVEAIFSKFKDRQIPFLSAKTTAIEALSFALEIEKQSFDQYSYAAENAENNEAAAVYRFLASEENRHYIIIHNTIDFIDAPGRWLYEEENLIFRH